MTPCNPHLAHRALTAQHDAVHEDLADGAASNSLPTTSDRGRP